MSFTGVIDRALAARDRLVASQKFRSWAAAFPLTRPVARRRTRALFDLCAGFVYAQILQACLELGVFDRLASGPRSLGQLAPELGLAPERAARLVDAAIALRLLQRRSRGRVGLGKLGAALVGNQAIAGMVAHHRMLYADLADPVALLRAEPGTTALGRYWNYDPAAGDAGQAAYTTLMAQSQALIAGEVLDACSLDRATTLMDVGGGSGSFLIAAAARAASLRLVLFDLPAVARQGEARLAAAGLGARARVVQGSFVQDALPVGADVISLVRVVHDHDDDVAQALLQAVHDALPAGGTLLLAEPMAETPGAEPIGDAYFGFYLLAMGRGRPRSAARLTAMLRQAGFARIRARPTHTPALVSVLLATRG